MGGYYEKKIALLLACAALALTACGSSEPTATTAAAASEAESEETAEAETTAAESSEAETESSEAAKEFAEKGKELLNNDLVTVTLGEPIDESYYIGYSATIENKSSDQYVLVSIDNGSVDGLMTYISLQGGSVAPGKKSNAELRIYTEDLDIKTSDELKNVEGAFSISTNTDGGNSYNGSNERFPFSIAGDSATTEESESTAEGAAEESVEESAQTSAADTKILLDNDLAKITLGDPVEDSYYVGYAITIENKSDSKYILVSVDNGSVDGFMTYISVQGSTVAPGKKSKSELQIYTEDLDIKTADELKNVEGAFSISTNTDGGNSYNGSNERYPFSIPGNAADESAAEEVTEQQ